MALKAAEAGQIYLDGLCIRAQWRKVASRTQDARDFDARGGNLTSSRDLFRKKSDGKKGGKKRSRSRSRSRSRDRKKKSCSRKKKSRSRSREKEKDKKDKDKKL